MADFDDYVYFECPENDTDVTTTPANFEEVHELLEKLKEKEEEPQNLSVMEPEFRKPKLQLNNPANDMQRKDRYKVHGFAEARKLQQKQNGSAKGKK